MNNIKLERLNHNYQEAISKILMMEVKDKDIKFVSITGVDVTNDLSYAKVYYTVLDREKMDSTAEALEKAAPFIRSRLANTVEVRHTPELKFIYDKSIAYGEHIEEIIGKLNEEKKD